MLKTVQKPLFLAGVLRILPLPAKSSHFRRPEQLRLDPNHRPRSHNLLRTVDAGGKSAGGRRRKEIQRPGSPTELHRGKKALSKGAPGLHAWHFESKALERNRSKIGLRKAAQQGGSLRPASMRAEASPHQAPRVLVLAPWRAIRDHCGHGGRIGLHGGIGLHSHRQAGLHLATRRLETTRNY